MVKLSFLFIVFYLVFSGAGCATNQKSVDDLAVDIAEPNRIRFQGKGSAAGFMLSGSMGPMGIAIGVAIDEGIAKDIQAAADTSNFMAESIVRRAYLEAGNTCEITGIDLNRYGFKMKRGSDDLAVADVESRIHYKSREPGDLTYPAESTNDVVALRQASLDDLKSDGQLAQALISEALIDVFSRACL